MPLQTTFDVHKNLQSGVAVTVLGLQMTGNGGAGGRLAYLAQASDGNGNQQADSGAVSVAVANVGGALTITVSAVGDEAKSTPTGTFTVAFSAVQDSNDPTRVDVQVTLTSSLTNPILLISTKFDDLSLNPEDVPF